MSQADIPLTAIVAYPSFHCSAGSCSTLKGMEGGNHAHANAFHKATKKRKYLQEVS